MTTVFVIACMCACRLAFAQCDDKCCAPESGGQAPGGVMLCHGHNKGEWMISYRYMNMMMGGNLLETTNVPDEQLFGTYIMSPDKMMMHMHMLMAMYGISNNLTLMAMGSYNQQSMSMNMFPVASPQMKGMNMPAGNSGQMVGTTSGLGDTKLYAIYKALSKNRQSVLLTAGLSIPTGSINQTDASSMNLNNVSSYTMQLGSGSYEFLPGLTYVKAFNHFSWGSQASAVFRLNDNTANYRLGNEYAVTSWVSYKWFKWISNSIRVENSYTESMSGYDARIYPMNEPGSNPINSGREQLNLFAGANFYVPNGFLNGNTFSIEFGIPAYQSIQGIQMKQHSILFAAWNYSF